MKLAQNQLTARQQQFCAFYTGEAKHNSALAARMAGYAAGSSHVTGCQLLQQPKIAAVVRGLQAAAAQEMDVNRQRVLNELQEAAALAKLIGQPMAIIVAWKAVAQAAGLDKPVVSVTGGQTNSLDGLSVEIDRMNRMSEAELMTIIEQGSVA